MFQEIYPIFKKDMLLKADMLSALEENPRNLATLLYAGHSDGMLEGGRVKVKGGGLAIGPGVLKYRGTLYQMVGTVEVPYQAGGEAQYLKLHFTEGEEKGQFMIHRSEFRLDSEPPDKTREMEFCRFLLKNGAELRQDYKDLSDFTTVHNTVNRVFVPYAAIGGSTLSPEVTSYYGRELFRCGPGDPYDICFAMECLRGQAIGMGLLFEYLLEKGMATVGSQLTNQSVHRSFVELLGQLKQGGGSGPRGGRGQKRMIVE